MPRSRWTLGAAAVALGTALLASSGGLATAATSPTASGARPAAITPGTPCGALAGATPVVHHVVWVVFENKSLSMFASSPAVSAPYLSHLAAACGSATQYTARPYYGAKLAMTSGSDWGSPGDVKKVPGPDLFSQLAGDWRVYMGDMPSACSFVNTKTYFARHNPAIWYADVAADCATRDLPLPGTPAELDLSASFTWVEANVPESMHGCRTLCPTTQQQRLLLGDTWASTWVDGILSSPQYLSGDTVVIVSWDQATLSQSLAPFVVVSPWTTPGTVSSLAHSHYSLLRGTQDLLGLPPLLGSATVTTSVAADFGLAG
ncbi:MAG: alkaline phosphatase family protein [Actinomycetota bacterium]|nr:alkaline phosphatase family protein [Actinomycetota bacterium]